ncbi:MAG: helix-turn-helix transcriptional regulator [Bacteroidetes bacterium]|nr:helix-turn-helix transcriptional regulator [Bacteroidota bacterium]
MKTIGNKIRVLREMRGFSQEYMAEQIGISQTGYSRLEREAEGLTLGRLEQIANVLAINPIDLITMDEKFVFNNCESIYNVVNNGTLTVNERKMYEEKINLLEELLTTYRKLTKDGTSQ